jgi:hypothetical protein
MAKLVFCPATPYVLDRGFLNIPIAQSSEYCFYVLFSACAFVMALVFKRWALGASISFGELVKICFGLFHQDLLEKMAGEAALEDERRAWIRLRRSILVDRSAWLPEWEKDEEQEKVQNADTPVSRSCLERALIPGLTVAFLVKGIFRGGRNASAWSGSRTEHTVLVEGSC